MKPYERETLLERVDRGSSFVGSGVPEEVEVDGEEIRLKEVVLGLRSESKPDPDYDPETLKKKLRRKRSSLYNSLQEENNGMSYERGKEIVDLIVGLDRALTSIRESVKGSRSDLNEEARRAETADQKRWNNFLNKVTSDVEDDKTRR
ncbi:DUF5788 family protein [Halorutilales archaeon Cl-col2-1]